MNPAEASGPFRAGFDIEKQGVAVCAHCSELLPGRNVQREIDGALKAFCSLGCAFIAEQITLARSRLGCATEARLADDRTVAEQQTQRGLIEIRGMACAACAALIEARLRATPGVAVANVDFASRRATVMYDGNRVAPQALQQVVERAGYRVVAGEQPDRERRSRRIDLLRITVAWQALIAVLMIAVPGYLAPSGQTASGVEQLMRIVQAVLTMPVLLFSAAPLWRAAASQLRVGQIGMEVPVLLGLVAALGASVASLLAGHGAVFFDSITLLVALSLSVKWWQQRALNRASQRIDAAVERTLSHAQRLRNHPCSPVFETIASDRLSIGDRVIVPAGALVPTDGQIVEGNSALSQSWLTGESAPFDVGPGARVLAGSLNLEQPLVVEVLECGERTSFSALQRQIVEAASQRPRPIELANRVAAPFAWTVLAVSLATALGWWMLDPSAAWPNAIAVLIVACPCALLLAAPLAGAMAQAALARRGVLVARASALEELARVDAVALHKTGTLTEPAPVVTGILAIGERDDADCLRMAASLASRSSHPFGRALVRTAQQAGVALASVSSLTEVAGAGVEGLIDGQRIRFGKPDYALALVGDLGAPLDIGSALAAQCGQGGTGLILADPDGPLAIILFGEQIRAEASSVLEQLVRQGHDLMLVSGDRRDAVETVAGALGCNASLKIYAEQTPANQQALLARWQKQGRRIAVIGNGVNGGPLLAQADASIALACDSGLAQARADLVCLRSSWADVGFVFELARRTRRIVRANLACALVYSAAMVPLAVTGHVSPLTAAVGMAASSALVLLNSLRLRARPPAA